MRPAPVILSLALWCAYCRGEATAQTDSALAGAIARQERVQVQVGAGTKVELRQPKIEGPMLVGQLGADGARTEYPVQGISQVWRRESAAGVGFKIGALIGAAAGGALGIEAGGELCLGSCGSPNLTTPLAAGLVFGAAVGGLGALFGAMTEHWRSVYKTGGVSAAPIITSQRLGLSLTF